MSDVTGEVNVMPIPEGQCEAVDCAGFVIETEHKRPSSTQRSELESTLRDLCMRRAGCSMGNPVLGELIERMPHNA